MIKEAILRRARNREPDFVIGGKDNPYLRRHWLIPRNPVFNIYVHEFLRSDDDRALHTHPWLFNASWLLEGEYIEWMPADDEHLMPDVLVRCEYPGVRVLKAGNIAFRWGSAPHRVQLLNEIRLDSTGWPELTGRVAPCWTVFITGPRVREWGFLCKKGFVHWKRFTAAHDKGAVGAGCDA